MATSAGDETEGNAPAPEELATDLAVLRARLERAEGVLAIQALKARYAELVDRRYRKGAVVPAEELAALADEVARLFTEDGVWDGGPALGRAVGRAAIAERLRDTTLVFARHLFTSPRIEVDDDGGRARGRWELLSPCRTAEGRDILDVRHRGRRVRARRTGRGSTVPCASRPPSWPLTTRGGRPSSPEWRVVRRSALPTAGVSCSRRNARGWRSGAGRSRSRGRTWPTGPGRGT